LLLIVIFAKLSSYVLKLSLFAEARSKCSLNTAFCLLLAAYYLILRFPLTALDSREGQRV